MKYVLSEEELRDYIANAHASGAYIQTKGKWGIDHDAEGVVYANEIILALRTSSIRQSEAAVAVPEATPTTDPAVEMFPCETAYVHIVYGGQETTLTMDNYYEKMEGAVRVMWDEPADPSERRATLNFGLRNIKSVRKTGVATLRGSMW